MNLSLNYTSFASPKVAAELRLAMTHVLNTGESVRLKNRKGDAWLLVTLHKDASGYHFAYIDTDGRERGDDILKASLRCWSDIDSMSFWRLHSKAFDLKEHPLVTIARNDAAQRAQKARNGDLRAKGCTHQATTYGGAQVFYGAYQRDWLGRKRFYALRNDGEFYKVSKEAMAMVARLEVI